MHTRPEYLRRYRYGLNHDSISPFANYKERVVDSDERALLTMVCLELDALRAERDLQPPHRRELLMQIESRARDRLPIAALVRELLGVSGQDLRGLASELPGLGPGQADEEI